MATQNRIETVSKFIGHRSANQTFATYWDVQMEELSSVMNIPWLQRENSDRNHATGNFSLSAYKRRYLAATRGVPSERREDPAVFTTLFTKYNS